MNPPDPSDRSVIEVLMAHRSVRAFRDVPLEAGVLECLVEAGTRASTSANMQAYTVISLTEPALKKHIAGLCADQTQIHQSAAFLVFCADLHKLTLACQRHEVDAGDTAESEALLMAVIDTALVMQNVAVAAESLGLGICMIGAMRNHPYEVADALQLPPRVIALAGMCIGVPTGGGEVKPRLPLAATLHVNKYPADRELLDRIDEYDQIQAAWYAERAMHVDDARWSAVVSKRVPVFSRRKDVGRFLRDREFATR
jgi:FMN reductase (NADPH)